MLNISVETEQLARLLAAKSGKSPEAVVREAIEQHAVTSGLLPARPRRPIDARRVDEIIERASSRPVLDPRTRDEIIGYDEFGIPK